MSMNKPTADIITKKAIQAIKDAFASDPTLAGYAVLDNGGNFTGTTLDMNIRITDTVAINAVIGHQTDQSIAFGLALPGTKIKYNGKVYTVIDRGRKFYKATDEFGKLWRVPFQNSTLAP